MSIFRFKQFSIKQEHSALKVGTDGVLLGAWANIEKGKHILDIGTGTGLIAIMCAQRNTKAAINGVELDEKSALEAQYNAEQSPWSDRIQMYHLNIFDYKPKNHFDHIISNPPFFEVHYNQDNSPKKRARQQTNCSINRLAFYIKNNLKTEGKCHLIYPYRALDQLNNAFNDNGLYLQRRCDVIGRQGAQPVRVMVEYGFEPKRVASTALIIEVQHRHDYSADYRLLTKDFYLKF